MKHEFTDPDLLALDEIWPIGQQLVSRQHGAIIVAGAYKGRYIRYCADRFPDVKITGYEPQTEIFNELYQGLKHNQNIKLVNGGLGTANRRCTIFDAGTDGASFLSLKGKSTFAHMHDAVERVHADAVDGVIDAMILNMEGYEYALLPYLMGEMMSRRILSLAVQFHPDYVSIGHALRVQDLLHENYRLIYSDTNNWTHWVR